MYIYSVLSAFPFRLRKQDPFLNSFNERAILLPLDKFNEIYDSFDRGI